MSPELPEFIRRAIDAQGKVDADEVAAQADESVIPSDEAEFVFQMGEWWHEFDNQPPPTEEILPPPTEQFAIDIGEAEHARDEAMDTATEHADPDWQAKAWKAILTLVDRGKTFTSDDVWIALGETPSEPRALGPLLNQASRQGLIVNTQTHLKSKLPARHARPIAIWKPL